jgi:hypothetical protein
MRKIRISKQRSNLISLESAIPRRGSSLRQLRAAARRPARKKSVPTARNQADNLRP